LVASQAPTMKPMAAKKPWRARVSGPTSNRGIGGYETAAITGRHSAAGTPSTRANRPPRAGRPKRGLRRWRRSPLEEIDGDCRDQHREVDRRVGEQLHRPGLLPLLSPRAAQEPGAATDGRHQIDPSHASD